MILRTIYKQLYKLNILKMNNRKAIVFILALLLSANVVCAPLSSTGTGWSTANFKYFEEGETPYPETGRCRDVCRQLNLQCGNLRAAVCESKGRVSWTPTEPIKSPSDFFIVGGICSNTPASNFGECFDSEVCLPDNSQLDLRKDFRCGSGGMDEETSFSPETISVVKNETVKVTFSDILTNMSCEVRLRNGTQGVVYFSDGQEPLYYLRCLNTWDCRAKYGSLYRDDWSEFTKLVNLTPRVTSVSKTNSPGIYFCKSEKCNVTLFDEVFLNLNYLRLTKFRKEDEDDPGYDRNAKRNSQTPHEFDRQYYFNKIQNNDMTTFQCQATTMMYMDRFLWTLRLGRGFGFSEVKKFGDAEAVNYTAGLVESNLTLPTSQLGPEYLVQCSIARRDSSDLLEISTPVVLAPQVLQLNLSQETPTLITCSVKSHPDCKPPNWKYLNEDCCKVSRPLELQKPPADGTHDRCSSTLPLIPSEWWHQAANCTLICTLNPSLQEGIWGVRSAMTQLEIVDDRESVFEVEVWHAFLILALFTAFFGLIIYEILRRTRPPLTFSDIERYIKGAVPKHFKNCETRVERIPVDPARNFPWTFIKMLTGDPLGAGHFGVVHNAVLEVSLIQDTGNRSCINLGNDYIQVDPKDVSDGRLICCVKIPQTMTGRVWREMLYDVSLILTVMGSEERWKDRIVEYFGYHMCGQCPFAGIVMRKYHGTLEEYISKLRAAYVVTSDMANGQPVASSGYYIRRGVVMTDADLVEILINVAKGMVCLENLKIVHGDLKPDNVFYTKEADSAAEIKVYIGDFGQAKIYDRDRALMNDKRHIHLRPPEDINNTTPSEKTDVWAFGMLAMHIFDLCNHVNDPYRGRAPVRGENERHCRYLERHLAYLNQENRAEITPNTPAGVRELINRCWSTRPEDRPGFDEILESLRETLRQVSVSVAEFAAMQNPIVQPVQLPGRSTSKRMVYDLVVES